MFGPRRVRPVAEAGGGGDAAGGGGRRRRRCPEFSLCDLCDLLRRPQGFLRIPAFSRGVPRGSWGSLSLGVPQGFLRGSSGFLHFLEGFLGVPGVPCRLVSPLPLSQHRLYNVCLDHIYNAELRSYAQARRILQNIIYTFLIKHMFQTYFITEKFALRSFAQEKIHVAELQNIFLKSF